MSIFDKAKESVKETAKKVKDVSTDLVSDDQLANIIIAATAKQDKVNEALKAKGSDYRIGGVDVEMGIPPGIVFGISKVSD